MKIFLIKRNSFSSAIILKLNCDIFLIIFTELLTHKDSITFDRFTRRICPLININAGNSEIRCFRVSAFSLSVLCPDIIIIIVIHIMNSY